MTHKEKLTIYLQNGGSQKVAKDLAIPNLQNMGKLSYLLSQMNVDLKNPTPVLAEQTTPVPPLVTPSPTQTALPKAEKKVSVLRPSKQWEDTISQYPVSMHETYNQRHSNWLTACSLKMQLNELEDHQEREAYELQKQIMRHIHAMEKCQNALHYYNETNRELPTKTEENYNGWSQSQLITKRNNLRTNISQRKNTIAKKTKELPAEGDPTRFAKLGVLQTKIEELRQKELEMEKLDSLIE